LPGKGDNLDALATLLRVDIGAERKWNVGGVQKRESHDRNFLDGAGGKTDRDADCWSHRGGHEKKQKGVIGRLYTPRGGEKRRQEEAIFHPPLWWEGGRIEVGDLVYSDEKEKKGVWKSARLRKGEGEGISPTSLGGKRSYSILILCGGNRQGKKVGPEAPSAEVGGEEKRGGRKKKKGLRKIYPASAKKNKGPGEVYFRTWKRGKGILGSFRREEGREGESWLNFSPEKRALVCFLVQRQETLSNPAGLGRGEKGERAERSTWSLHPRTLPSAGNTRKNMVKGRAVGGEKKERGGERYPLNAAKKKGRP